MKKKLCCVYAGYESSIMNYEYLFLLAETKNNKKQKKTTIKL